MKKRNWAFVVYEDSLPFNWKDLLSQSGLKCAVSPYHDRDINADGTNKKPHYHIIACWDNPTTYNNAYNFASQFGVTGKIQGIESVVGYYRYLTHKDNPEKAQYDESNILLFNGFDPTDLMTSTERLVLIKQLIVLLKEKSIFQYEDLLFYLLENDLTDLFQISVTHCFFVQQLLASRRCKKSIAERVNKS